LRRAAASASCEDVVRALSTAVVIVDAELRITFANQSAESLLGASESRLLGRRIGEVVQPSDELVELCQRALDSRLAFLLRGYECRGLTRALILDCRVNPFADDRNLLLELNDTTFERRLRQDAELIAQQKVSRTIIRQLAHEVKNPLGGMRGSAQLLQRQLHDDGLIEYTRVIIEEVDRLAALVDSILRPGGRLELLEHNPHEVTEHVAALIEAEKPAGVTLERDYDPSLPPLRMDRHQLIQALLNIVRNALQAVGEAGKITIRTRAQHSVNLGPHWHRLVLCIEVEDDGPGIPADLLENVFYPLVSGRTEGSGIGLSIAQDLVANHHGLIEVQSEPGQTRFTVRLPYGIESHDTEKNIAGAEGHD
jgi:two-component system nitrogen regulation sensor histidine kinase GlnL